MQGEPDTVPFTRIFHFYNRTDYTILSNTIRTIKNKLSKKMRINLNEALYIYLHYIIYQLRFHKKRNEIILKASKLLTPEQVMIGVPESIRKINFKVKITNSHNHSITIIEPISTSAYVLSP